MRILFFTPALPLPPFSGGQVRSLNLLKQINKKHDVTLFSFIRSDSENSYVADLKAVVSSVRVFKRRGINSPANLKNLLRLPFAAALYYDPTVLQALKEELKMGYDLVHFESFYTFPYLQPNLGVKTVAGNENIEYLIYERYADTHPEPVRTLMKMDIARMKRFEETSWRNADGYLAVSETDLEKMEEVTGRNGYLVPNGIDLEMFNGLKRNVEESLFLFVGPTKYIQNNDAAKFLVSSIWPEIKKQIPAAKLWFVGQKQQDWLLKLNQSDIKVQTDLKDIREAYSRAAILLAPLRAGSGTKFKVLEAFACGVPVITTRVGIEGIEAQSGDSYLEAETPNEFANAAKALLEDLQLNAKIALRAKKLVADKYSWDKIGRSLIDAYAQIH